MADNEEDKKEEVKEEKVNNVEENNETTEEKAEETKKEEPKKEETKKEETKKTETKKEEKATIDTEKIKQESKATFDGVKDSVKNVDLKNDTEETKNLVVDLFKNPVKKMKSIAKKGESSFKIAVLLLIVWTAVILIMAGVSRMNVSGFSNFGRSVLFVIKAIIAPILSILTLSGVIFVMNKSSKKSLTTIITTVTFARIPVIAATVLQLLTIISSRVSMITDPINSFANIISIVLLYFGVKELLDEKEDNTFVKTFALIFGIYYIVSFVLSFLGIAI